MIDADGGPLDNDNGTANQTFASEILAGPVPRGSRLALVVMPRFGRKFRQVAPGQAYTPMLARGLSFGFQFLTNSASFSSFSGKTIIRVTS